jgi:glutamate--cysteine ligase
MARQFNDAFTVIGNQLPQITAYLNTLASTCGFPVYTSLDVRDAGFKVAVVDVNLFPAGWNNLSAQDFARASNFMREFFAAKLLVTPPYRIVVVPEANTNNAGYLENIAGIISLLEHAQCDVRLLWPGEPAIPKAWVVKTSSGRTLTYLPAQEALDRAQALLLNHDLSGGIPKLIQDVQLPTFPSTRLGWFRRRKSAHQEIVAGLLNKIAKQFADFDPWYFQARTLLQKDVDFSSEQSLQVSADLASDLLKQIANDYRERGIVETPRVFVKNDAGTYGMGVVSIEDPLELTQANRKLRNKMRVGKESVPISQVIVQESVPTALVYDKVTSQGTLKVAGEPVLYMINGIIVGGFMRIHEALGEGARHLSLNQPGSLLDSFECPDNAGHTTRPFPQIRGESVCNFASTTGLYGFLARLHALAAGLEECPA